MTNLTPEEKKELIDLLGSGYDHTNALDEICDSECEKSHTAKDVASMLIPFLSHKKQEWQAEVESKLSEIHRIREEEMIENLKQKLLGRMKQLVKPQNLYPNIEMNKAYTEAIHEVHKAIKEIFE